MSHSIYQLLPMGHVFLFIVSMLGLAVEQGHGAVTNSEAYWHSMLPDTPMPTAIRDHLSSSGDVRRTFAFQNGAMVKTARNGADATITGPEGNPVTIHRYTKRPVTLWLSDPYGRKKDWIEAPNRDGATSLEGKNPARFWLSYIRTSGKNKDQVHSTDDLPSAVQLNDESRTMGINSHRGATGDIRIDAPSALSSFLERNLRPGARIEAVFRRPVDGDHFLSPRAAGSIPFSSSKLSEILNLFSIDPNSYEGKEIRKAHYFCELPPAPGEKKCCATTLESMVDFVASSLNGSIIRALTARADQETMSPRMYTVESIWAVPMQGSTALPCHLEVYPYTVYHCHLTRGVKPYVIKLVGQLAGDTAEAVATCHRDTSDWVPEHPALRAHKVKPGEASVCHLLPLGDFAFVPIARTADVAAQ